MVTMAVTMYRPGGAFLNYFRGKVESERFKTQFPTGNCGVFEFNLR